MNIKSLCMYMYNEILHSCSKDRGGPPTRGVEGTPTAQRVEVEAAGWGGAVSSGCLPCICARHASVCAEAASGRTVQSTVTCRIGPGRRRDSTAGPPYSSPPLILPESLRQTMTVSRAVIAEG